MDARTPPEVWSAVLGTLQLEVTRHAFETWLKDTQGLDCRDGRFVVGVPSPFVAECLQKRMAPLIARTLGSVLKQDVEVAFEVRAANNGPNGHSAESPASAVHPDKPRGRTRPTGQLNPRYTFDTFVVGKSNRLAHAAAMAVAENPGAAYNPLVIHSGVGLGKTHLLHAIAHAARANGLTFIYASAEQYTNDFVSALRENRVEEFRAKYRTLDLLLIDDIQFIAGKEHSRESFFHTFNDLHGASKQIVITSDTRPKFIPLLEERLSSRLEAGLLADIQPPDLETRMAILERKAHEEGVALRQDVVEFLARRIARNVRDLEGALNRVVAMARLTDRPVDLELCSQAIADLTPSPTRTRRANAHQIIAAVATYYDLSTDDLTGKSRKKGIALARQVAAYLLREDTDRSLADIGALLGDRAHTTVLRAHEKIAYHITTNAEVRRQITEIRSALDRGLAQQPQA